jgi:hypothetical protein
MKILVAGCSISSGWGFEDEKLSPDIWPNLVGKYLDAQVINVAKTASSNADIFLQVLHSLTQNNYDLVLVQWTGFDRITLAGGLDSFILINTVVPDTKSPIFQGIPIEDLRGYTRVITTINNMWKAFVDLSTMTEILTAQATPVYFINGNLPWTTDFFYNPKHDTFTRTLLSIDTDEVKVREIINQTRQQFDPTKWVNLPQGWQYSQRDNVSETDIHAGVESHKFYATQVVNFLKEQQCQT